MAYAWPTFFRTIRLVAFKQFSADQKSNYSNNNMTKVKQ